MFVGSGASLRVEARASEQSSRSAGTAPRATPQHGVHTKQTYQVVGSPLTVRDAPNKREPPERRATPLPAPEGTGDRGEWRVPTVVSQRSVVTILLCDAAAVATRAVCAACRRRLARVAHQCPRPLPQGLRRFAPHSSASAAVEAPAPLPGAPALPTPAVPHLQLQLEPAHPPPATAPAPALALGGLALAGAAFALAPLLSRLASRGQPQPRHAAGTSSSPRESSASNTLRETDGAWAGADTAPPLGWWRSLARVHYVACGPHHGALPRVALDPRRPARATLVAFEDAADADYVAGCLRGALTGAAGGSPHPFANRASGGSSVGTASKAAPVVVSAGPLSLEDVGALQGTDVAVLPRGRLRHGAALGLGELSVLLQEALAPPGAAWPRSASGSESAAPAGAAAAAADAAVAAWQRTPDTEPAAEGGEPRGSQAAAAAAAAAAEADMAQASASAAAAPVVGAPEGGFAPVSTDLPELLLRSLQALPGGMAAAAAAVADASAAQARAPSDQGGAHSSTEPVAGEQEQQRGSSHSSAAAHPSDAQPVAHTPPRQPPVHAAPSETPKAAAKELTVWEAAAGARTAAEREAPLSAAAPPEASQAEVPQDPESANQVGQAQGAGPWHPWGRGGGPAARATLLWWLPPPRAGTSRAISPRCVGRRAWACHAPPLLQGLLEQFYALEALPGGGTGDPELDAWLMAAPQPGSGEAAAAGREQRTLQQPVQPAGTGQGTGSGGGAAGRGSPAAAGSGPGGVGGDSGGALGSEVARLRSQVGTLLGQSGDERGGSAGSAASGGPSERTAGGGAAAGLLAAHGQLQALQARVSDSLASLTSKQAMAGAGLLAADGTVDRRAGLAAMVQLQDTLEGERGHRAREVGDQACMPCSTCCAAPTTWHSRTLGPGPPNKPACTRLAL